MNAPEALIQSIAIEQLFPSPTNPRKRFNQAKLEELAASIKAQGVLQPILVRPWNVEKDQLPHGKTFGDMVGAHEVIAGERRYRASKLAGLEEIPCFVRNLTDLQVLHAQVIENLQRDDLHPIEEAEGYELLMQKTDEAGNKFTADTIAVEVGKSRSYVYGRLNLLKLCSEAREAFFEGEIESSIATDISRIPTQLLQIEALNHIIDNSLSYRVAKAYIQRNFMLDLEDAPFDIKCANLLGKAGACVDCIKRTGNQPELFDDVKSKDVCTDTACFAEKKAAHIEITLQNAEENGDKVVRKEEAQEMLGNSWQVEYRLQDANLARLTDSINGEDNGPTWQEALEQHKLLSGKKAIKKTVIENPHEEGVIVTINTEEAMSALTKAGFELPEEKETEAQAARAKQIAEQQKKRQEEADQQKAEQAKHNAIRARLFTTLRQKIADDFAQGIVAEGLYRMLAEEIFDRTVDDYEDADELFKHYLPDSELEGLDEDAANALIGQIDASQLFLFMLDCLMIGERTVPHWNLDSRPTRMLQAAEATGINAEDIEQEVLAELAAATPAKTTKKGKK